MIELITSGKIYQTLEKLIASKGITSVDNEDGLKKEINKGNKVYAYVDLYDEELSSGTDITLRWNLDKDKAQAACDLAGDEI